MIRTVKLSASMLGVNFLDLKRDLDGFYSIRKFLKNFLTYFIL